MECSATISKRNEILRRIGEYVGAVVISVLVFWVLYDLWGVSLRFPIAPLVDDALAIQAILFKNAVDNRGIFFNPYVGAPFGMDLTDLPMPDVVVWGAAKFVALFTKNHMLVRNIVMIGSFPLMTVTSLYVMRRLGISYLVSLGASLLFSFSNFHHLRSIHHVFIAIGYFTIPVVALLAIELAEDRPLFFVPGERWYKPRWVNNRPTWVMIAWCVVMGLTGSVYYPFFTVYILLIATVFAATRLQSTVALINR